MTGWNETLLNAYLDGALDGARAREVERLLASDPAARQELARLSYVVGLVRASARRRLAEPPPRLLEAIAAHESARPSRRQTLGWALAVAAGGLALAGAGAFGGFVFGERRTESQFVRLAVEKEDDRWLSEVADYIRLYSTDQRHLVEVEADRKGYIEKWLGERLELPLHVPDLSSLGLVFRGARLLAVNGRPAAQLVYLQGDGKPLGLCITRTERPDWPPAMARRGDLSLLHWGRAGSAYVLIGWTDETALRTIWADARTQLNTAAVR